MPAGQFKNSKNADDRLVFNKILSRKITHWRLAPRTSHNWTKIEKKTLCDVLTREPL